jgi:RNA polymerase sigma-70 factor (ECF subfamily)
VFILRFIEELSIEEVAAATNLGASTVKTHLRRGLQKIRKQLELEGVR